MISEEDKVGFASGIREGNWNGHLRKQSPKEMKKKQVPLFLKT